MPDPCDVKGNMGKEKRFKMTPQETEYFRVGFARLGAGYTSDAYMLAGMIISAAIALRSCTGDYPEHLQDAMHKLEAYALSRDDGIEKVQRSFYDDEECCVVNMPPRFADSQEIYDIFREFDLHRLSPNFQSASLNQDIRNARAEYAATHPPKPKGFWASLFG